MKLSSSLNVALAAALWSTAGAESVVTPDPCAVLASRKWVKPAEARACFASYKVDPVVKENVRLLAGRDPNLRRLCSSR